MTVTLTPELAHHVNALVAGGDYPSPGAVLAEAVKALVREQERLRIDALLDENGIDSRRLNQLLQEARESGDYTEMTAQDWVDIEREGLAVVNSRRSA